MLQLIHQFQYSHKTIMVVGSNSSKMWFAQAE